MADIAHMDLMAAITQNLRYKQDGVSRFHVCSCYFSCWWTRGPSPPGLRSSWARCPRVRTEMSRRRTSCRLAQHSTDDLWKKKSLQCYGVNKGFESKKQTNDRNGDCIAYTDNFYRCRHKDYVKIYFLANLSLFFIDFLLILLNSLPKQSCCKMRLLS